MASRCNRLMNKASISSIKSAFMSAPKSPSSSPKFPLPSRSTASPVPRFSVSRHMIFQCMREMNWDLQDLSSYHSWVYPFQGDLLAESLDQDTLPR
ncbi:hypothetical protein M8C21_001628 [Ambrosia artemisiifolia]|uniref:Uncharacterized protein n=1 Tax=Ambrosia artemisiifolia TaxID=4212 RepID=A0AAD5CIE5_AMBAR|nr:hypothetical protein M8C21_001628 [Ambrosia artemisiifolia]